MHTSFRIGDREYPVNLPDSVDMLRMKGAQPLQDHEKALTDAFEIPIGCKSFGNIIQDKLASKPEGEAVIVISDNTRPVPYKGAQGILLPIIHRLLDAGVAANMITVLCANGTHTPLPDAVFRTMLDPAVYELGIRIVNHDCRDEDQLKFIGYSSKGTKIRINRLYADAHIKILTGLVESHFMAGVSGGRKAICPGLIGEDSIYVFHSASYLDNPESRDLHLSGNPCHIEAMEVASTVGADFILNVTLNQDFQVTGYFGGDMVQAHLAAFESVREEVGVQASGQYDIVVTHAGFVGRNHYQAAKAGVAAIPLLKEDSILIMAADCTDSDPVGKPSYRSVLPYLKDKDADVFVEMLKSATWDFIPDQWQVQMWAKLFRVISQDQFIFYAPQIEAQDYGILPGVDGNCFVAPTGQESTQGSKIQTFLETALEDTIQKMKAEGRQHIRVAWLADGPYGIVRN
jgi:nickel-dependent lactate racemase